MWRWIKVHLWRSEFRFIFTGSNLIVLLRGRSLGTFIYSVWKLHALRYWISMICVRLEAYWQALKNVCCMKTKYQWLTHWSLDKKDALFHTTFLFNEYCSIMMTSSNGNIFRETGPLCGEFTGPGEFPTQRPVTRSFDVFFDRRLNKRSSKQPRGWWLETLSCSLWRQSNVLIRNALKISQRFIQQ